MFEKLCGALLCLVVVGSMMGAGGCQQQRYIQVPANSRSRISCAQAQQIVVKHPGSEGTWKISLNVDREKTRAISVKPGFIWRLDASLNFIEVWNEGGSDTPLWIYLGPPVDEDPFAGSGWMSDGQQ